MHFKQKMSKKGIKFISEFLIPSLNEEKFGDRLTWLDKEKKIFQMDWCHKGGPLWTEREAQVFVEWDKHKGHYHPEEKSYFTKSKQRFRALLYKLTSDGKIIPQQSKDKFVKVFSIGEKRMKRRKRSSTSSASDSSEYEMFESCLQGMSDKDFEEKYRRKVLEDSTKNILEDHSYTSVDYQSGIGTDTDHIVESCLMNIPNLAFFQELVNSSPEKSLMKWNNSFNGTNNSLISQQKSFNSTSEKVLVKFNYPYRECYESQQDSIEDQSEEVLLELDYPYTELDNNPFINSADLFLTPKVFPSTDLNLDFSY